MYRGYGGGKRCRREGCGRAAARGGTDMCEQHASLVAAGVAAIECHKASKNAPSCAAVTAADALPPATHRHCKSDAAAADTSAPETLSMPARCAVEGATKARTAILGGAVAQGGALHETGMPPLPGSDRLGLTSPNSPLPVAQCLASGMTPLWCRPRQASSSLRRPRRSVCHLSRIPVHVWGRAAGKPDVLKLCSCNGTRSRPSPVPVGAGQAEVLPHVP